ncbi:MFS transporter [Paenibacillus thalictri]|uniref:MFS transporter n=1 Tax=Paenibacillus thalictri TaxID=2527873 RepID=A0A4Q9DIF7_9BACL|nr:MFS transporter [Paenibacillus thalictri]TBL69960.1 MFS transporter [Paenibacillus thalictri]
MERLWTKPFILMTAGNLFLFVAFYMLYPTLPSFIKQMGGSESQVGLAMGTFALSAVIFRPLVGGLLDRFGRRPFIVSGLLLFTFAMYMYGWVGGIVVLIGLRILHGLSWALSTTAMITSITDTIPAARRGEGMGWFSTSMTLAMAIGPMFGIWVTQNHSYSTLFLFAVGLSVVALLLTFGAKMPFRPQTGTRKMELYEKSVLPIAASVFFLFISYGGITTFVPLFAGSIQVNSGAFFLTFAATLALSRPISGKLSDRFGEMVIIAPSLVVTIAAMIVLSVSTGLAGVLVSAVLYGIGFGSAQPAFQSATILLARVDRKGVANATISTANDLGIGLGAIMLGWVSQYASYQVLFEVSAVSVGISLILFSVFAKRVSKNKEQRKGEDSSAFDENEFEKFT